LPSGGGNGSNSFGSGDAGKGGSVAGTKATITGSLGGFGLSGGNGGLRQTGVGARDGRMGHRGVRQMAFDDIDAGRNIRPQPAREIIRNPNGLASPQQFLDQV